MLAGFRWNLRLYRMTDRKRPSHQTTPGKERVEDAASSLLNDVQGVAHLANTLKRRTKNEIKTRCA